jgi:NAD(P)-dependent dehydrogenase (short-subunit alcohol dehydrogenase family)
MDDLKSALIIGNSDGIGLGLTRRLLDIGWCVQGFSRSPGPIEHDLYSHCVVDVMSGEFPDVLLPAITAKIDLCVYCAGIGEELQLDALGRERLVFEVNLMGAVKTVEAVLPTMIEQSGGHIIVLSSMADQLISPEAPGYSASKAGLSSYIESMALAVRDRNVAVTNVRFGFVDTKMAKGGSRPFVMTVDRAVDHLLHCVKKRPVRYTRPRIMALLVRLLRFASWFRM